MTVSQDLKTKLSSYPEGAVFCANDFDDIGSRGNIDVILHRLSKSGLIRMLGYGLYDIPRKSQLLGDLSPDIKDVMNAYSRRMGQQFVLDPLNAANALGLTTQVPSKLMYLTDGKTHVLTVCGLDIHLIHTSSKKLAGAMSPIGVILQALRYFGPKGPSDTIIGLIAKKLSPNDLDSLSSLKNKLLRNMSPQIDRITKVAAIH